MNHHISSHLQVIENEKGNVLHSPMNGSKMFLRGWNWLAKNIRRLQEKHREESKSTGRLLEVQAEMHREDWKKYAGRNIQELLWFKNIRKAKRIHLLTCCRETDKHIPWIRQTVCIKKHAKCGDTTTLYSSLVRLVWWWVFHYVR